MKATLLRWWLHCSTFVFILLCVIACSKEYSVEPPINLVRDSLRKEVISFETSFGQQQLIFFPEDVVIRHNLPQDSIFKTRLWQGIPSVVCNADGSQLYAAWYTGGKGEVAGNYITVSLSLDHGKTWRNDVLTVYPMFPSTTRFFDPLLWRDKNGKIWLFWAKCINMPWDGVGGVYATELSWAGGTTVNNGRVQLLSDGVMLNKPIDLIDYNYSFLPISIWKSYPTPAEKSGAFVKVLKYNPMADKKVFDYSKVNVSPDSIRSFDEHQIVETQKGKFLCLLRTTKGIYFSQSNDKGKTWTVTAPFTKIGLTTSSRFYLGKLRSGNLLLIANNSSTRTQLKAFMSKDDGESWPYQILLDNREEISYPDASQDANGDIYIVYDRMRYSKMEIDFCRINEDMFRAPGVFSRQIISGIR
ncbi:sialidase family protein [Filimonas effusa]|uniref:Exo-alpha-sialidase n=1 Tax=Filimonas effusa TaxID=2508721 RepID=A0A4Q1DCV6_9BACT|nr:sialidase family protein [Filimonas effusa]RXK87341.1 exo-alpha-sialidase [Filimonas effusa]